MENKNQDWEFEIPKELFDGEEKVLKKRVVHFQKGIRRIFVFTIVGFVMGWFSYLYVNTSFFPMKAIIGIPYKINELIHNAIHGSHTVGMTLDEYFPNSQYLSVFAEYFMPTLFGGAIYGSMAYFTGDRKVFTYKRFAKFLSIWILIIAAGIGGSFLINARIREKNESLKNVTGFMVHSDIVGSTYMSGKNVETDVNQAIGSYLKRAFYMDGENLKEMDDSIRDQNGEQLLCLWFGKMQTSYMECQVNAEKKYIVTEQGKVYRITEDFVNMLEKYDREEGYDRYYERYEERGEMISYEELAD